MQGHTRSELDRRNAEDRRLGIDRRTSLLLNNPAFRLPAWRDQQLQYYVRFVVLIFAAIYFNLWENSAPLWLELTHLNLFFLVYGVSVALNYWQATKQKISFFRFRYTMLIDVIGVTVATINDPSTIPPCFLGFIIIAIGNGMRYGMRMFRESLILCLIATMIAVTTRYVFSGSDYSLDLMFINVLGVLILFYAYFLTGRLETTRSSLEDLSQRDELTGLLNRRAIHERVGNLLRINEEHKTELVVMFADLDKFKQINDQHGHAIGDMALKNVAEILTQSVRDVDISSRFGGDEFVIVMPNTSISVAEVVASRIQKSVSEWAQENELDFNISMGIGEIPRHGKTLDEVLRLVDNALYHSKINHGPGGLCFATS